MDDIVAKLIKALEKPFTALALGGAGTLLIIILLHLFDVGRGYWGPFFTFLHVASGITWIGLLYYFNLVQLPTMPLIPPEYKPAITKYIAPEALFWFRWAAAATVATGLIVFSTGSAVTNLTILLGSLFGLIMAYNVWFIIWPNQQKALGIIPASDEEKAQSGRVAMLTSRINFALSIPMLYCMVTARLVG